jgi:hypothetical protein
LKWKQNIGKIINGFEIIDSYIKIGDNGGKLARVKLISKGGAHLWNNVQLMCRACNMSKGAKYDDRQAEATA